MTQKRFYYNTFYHRDNMSRVLEYEIIDRQSYPNYPYHNEKEDIPQWYIYIGENDSGWQDMLVDLLNELNDECEFLEIENEALEDGATKYAESYHKSLKENEQLKKELHLMHMRTMFSTVQSFKGDVSKRYKYSKETDRIYDTANHYGQYNKILDKKEVVMLLNEYETVLNELKGDVQ